GQSSFELNVIWMWCGSRCLRRSGAVQHRPSPSPSATASPGRWVLESMSLGGHESSFVRL
ncbi:hypothetical protein HBI51_253050, partial [Parastagonospora nodorum]